MKKTVSLFFALISSSFCYGLYLGNPAEPEIIEEGMFISPDFAFTPKVGYQGDFVFNRNAEFTGFFGGRTDSFYINRNQGVLIFNIFDRAELYGSLGAMEVNFSHRPSIDHKRREYDFHNQFTWGTGGRAILFEWGHVCMGLDGKYQWARPSLQWVTVDGVSVRSSANMNYSEWQVGAAFSYDADLLIPYIGATYSNLHVQVHDLGPNVGLGRDSFTLHSRQHFGLALGCSLSSGKVADLTVEVKFFDEQSLSLAGNIKF